MRPLAILAISYFICWLSFSNAYEVPPPTSFDINLANSSVWFSAAASCSKEGYPSKQWRGPCTGFNYLGLIYDEGTDTQGHSNYLHYFDMMYTYFISLVFLLKVIMAFKIQHNKYGLYTEERHLK